MVYISSSALDRQAVAVGKGVGFAEFEELFS